MRVGAMSRADFRVFVIHHHREIDRPGYMVLGEFAFAARVDHEVVLALECAPEQLRKGLGISVIERVCHMTCLAQTAQRLNRNGIPFLPNALRTRDRYAHSQHDLDGQPGL